MKIQQIKLQNITLKDLKDIKKSKVNSSKPTVVRFGRSNILCYPEIKPRNMHDIIRVSNSPSLKETKLDKVLNWLDDFSKTIYISKSEMKDYAKQIAKSVAEWKRVFG